MNHLTTLRALGMGAVCWVSSSAALADGLRLVTEMQQETTVKTADGKSETKLAAVSKIVPGDPVVVVVRYENSGAKPADNVVIDNPIAKELAFTGEAAGAGTAIDYSVDSGKQFGPLLALKVAAADGTSRLATPADVTNIRWKMDRALKAGEKGQVQFKAVLR